MRCSSQGSQYCHCGMRLEKSRLPISGSKKILWSELFEGVVSFDQEEKTERGRRPSQIGDFNGSKDVIYL